MAVSETQEWDTHRSPDDAIEAVAQHISERLGGRVVRLESGYVEGRCGAWLKTRFLGGMAVSDSDLPLRLAVWAKNGDQGTRLRVEVADGVGFGARLGMEAKLAKRIEAVLEELAFATT